MILFIDCYDSFSYNLTHLISSACPAEVVVVHNDQISRDQLASYLPFIDAIVLGPGPGNPHNPEDSGIVGKIWDLLVENPVPTLGVCFGYQSMALAFGGQVERMDPPQHGRVGVVEHDGTSRLLKGVPSPFEVVRYHSLHSIVSSPLICTAKDFQTTPSSPTEMAAEHSKLPFYGVQFHPESVLSSYGRQLFKNFWDISTEYNQNHRKVLQEGAIPRQLTVNHTPLLNQWPSAKPDLSIENVPFVDWMRLAALFEEKVVLKSAAYPGDWTIIGLLEPGVTPHLRSKHGVVYEGPLKSDTVKSTQGNFWEYVAKYMESKLISKETASELNQDFGLPFLGGLVGYISYEGSCQYTVFGGDHSRESDLASDMSLVYVTKAILVNESTNKAHVLGPASWAAAMKSKIVELLDNTAPEHSKPINIENVATLEQSTYEKMFNKCQDSLKAGDSYELCLTTEAIVTTTPGSDWDLFEQLVRRNPAPYSSYMNFDDTLIATSPERFMSWDHERCEFRPIKGTVKKGDGMTKEKAAEILRSPKEQAENLMIVDLIRHDLGHLLGEVSTPQLMVVEEYHNVYQLVTSVEGRFKQPDEPEPGASYNVSGIDVLYQSLPPGSMTGAPKIRSVEILADIEPHSRGIYSGVHGYWSIDDRGDWSVVIRSLFRSKTDPSNRWRLGGGGAITVLSTVDGEYEEMLTKMDSVLKALR